MSAEVDRLWNIVRAHSSDFNVWTALIEETEKVSGDKILYIRNVYDAFLAEFPLCNGYWKKYADHEEQFGVIDKVVEVYEQAVQAVPYSVDIWLHYCTFFTRTFGDPNTIRRLFERGLAYVGTDYLSFPLWDRYIEYETMHQAWVQILMIYSRILENPNPQLDRFLNSYKELAGRRPLSELRTAEAATAASAASVDCVRAIWKEVQADGAEPSPAMFTEAEDLEKVIAIFEAAAAASSAVSEDGVQVNEKEAQPDVAEPSRAILTEVKERENFIAIQEEMYNKAKEFDSKIINFEVAIRRPYFDVEPLSAAELENWKNYLDFIERECDFDKVVKLYERCLIACANYPEYWIRYVLSMEASGSLDLANNALDRATQVFVKRQPEIHLFAARFKEQNGDIPGAQAAYQLVHSVISPGYLEAIMKHANMERHLGNMKAAYSLFEQAIAIEKGKKHSQTLPMLFAQYARFTYLVSLDAKKARAILLEAVEHNQMSKAFLEALIDFESIHLLPKQIDFVDSLVGKFVKNPNSASVADREGLSCISLEYLNLFGAHSWQRRAADQWAAAYGPNVEVTAFLVFSLSNGIEQIYYIAPIDRNNAEAPEVLASPMIRFNLIGRRARFECSYASGLYLFSYSYDRSKVNTDQLILFHPPSSTQIHVPSIPQVSGSNIYLVYYFLGCTLDHTYKILGVEWGQLADGTGQCSVSIRTVRRNSQWTIENEEWRRITISGLDFMSHEEKTDIFAAHYSVELAGGLYWWCYLTRVGSVVIGFDVASEQFRPFMTPFPDWKVLHSIFRVGGRLGLFALTPDLLSLHVWTLVDHRTNRWDHEPIDRGFHIRVSSLNQEVPWPVSTPFNDLVMIGSAASHERIWVSVLVRDSGAQILTRVVPDGWIHRQVVDNENIDGQDGDNEDIDGQEGGNEDGQQEDSEDIDGQQDEDSEDSDGQEDEDHVPVVEVERVEWFTVYEDIMY